MRTRLTLSLEQLLVKLKMFQLGTIHSVYALQLRRRVPCPYPCPCQVKNTEKKITTFGVLYIYTWSGVQKVDTWTVPHVDTCPRQVCDVIIPPPVWEFPGIPMKLPFSSWEFQLEFRRFQRREFPPREFQDPKFDSSSSTHS